MAKPARQPDEDRPWLRPVGEEEEITPPKNPVPTSGLALTGLILSIISLFVFGLILAPLGIVFGAFGLAQIKKGERSGRGLALSAITVGAVSFVLTAVFIAFITSASESALVGPGALSRLGWP